MTEKFGHRLRTLRRERLLTQKELADQAGIEVKVIVRAEGGQSKPTMRNMRRLAEALGVERSTLASGTDYVVR